MRRLVDWISTSGLIAMLRLLQLNPSLLRSITVVISVPVIPFIAVESVAGVLIIDGWRIGRRCGPVVVVACLVAGRLVSGHPSCSIHWSLAALTATAGVVAREQERKEENSDDDYCEGDPSSPAGPATIAVVVV